VRPGDTVFDIGANIGLVTLHLSKLVGARGAVHAFEPNPNLVGFLEKMKQSNAASNIEIHASALGERAGVLTLNVPPGNSGAASLLQDRNSATSVVHSVCVESLDDVVDRRAIRSIRLMKIDVEGYEETVLKGATRTLRSLKPDAILFELNVRTTTQFSDEPLIKLLRSFDYEFIAVPKCLVRMRLKRVGCLPAARMGHDFLAISRENFDQMSARLNVVD
jgi:FkbM family methyltransferase